ncbi:SPOR domain-containing protein [Marinifilum flexuosum]|uniref:SPOR domain-containing protein n=1 Tax=Marinifilum flexuosum TaxID=1117708 RepID=UPI00248F9FC7|nr:SPOR domain-containing protein [Marinifilum flexuosum]
MRNIYFIICFVLSVGTIGYFSPVLDLNFNVASSGSTSYAVEIAKYKYPVYTDYFENLEGVIELSSKEGDFHYISGITKSLNEAKDLRERLKETGYPEARVVDLLEEFSEEELEGVIKSEPQDKNVQKKKSAELAILKLTNVENAYFYTIKLKESKEILTANQFEALKPKVHKQEGLYYYLLGKFEDVGNAEKYLNDKVKNKYANAELLVMNKGQLVNVSKAKKAKNTKKTSEGSYNMGRKMRGKEYVDYYYESSSLKISKSPIYYIEIGPYADKEEADDAVQKLHDLGFTKAGVKDPSKDRRVVNQPDAAADAHYTIQIFAGKNKVKTSRFKLQDVSQSYDQHDKLYRYFVGNYDNYWVCRRELREVRKNGFRDAFIIKL